MPLESVARVAVSRHEVYFARAARVRDAHATAGENIAKILVVIVALVPHAGWKGAAQSALIVVLV